MTELTHAVVSGLLAGDDWNLADVGRLLLRVREDAVGPGNDRWYVLVPEVPNRVPCGTQTATVRLAVAVAGGDEVGGAFTVEAPGLSTHSLTAFVNLATTGPSSWAYFGFPAQTLGLPTSATLSVTTPLVTGPALQRLDVRLHAAGTTAGLGVHGGLVDGTSTQASAEVKVGQADILQAVAALAGKGLTGTLSTLTTASVTVDVPEQDGSPGALIDPDVRSCAGALLALSDPEGDPLSLPAADPLHVTLDLAAATSTYRWHAPSRPTATLGLVLKTDVVQHNLRNQGTLLNLAASLPQDASLVSTGTAYTYAGSAVVPSLDLSVSTSATVADPTQPAPAPQRTTRAHLDDLPRAARVDLADFDPALSVQVVAGVAFTTETGTPTAVRRLALSTRTDLMGVPAPAPLAAPALAVAYTAPSTGPATLTAQVYGLKSTHVRLLVAEPPGQPVVTQAHVDLALASAVPARIDATLGRVASSIAVDRLPVTATLDVDATRTLSPAGLTATGTWTAADACTVTGKVVRGLPADADFLSATATVRDLPEGARGEATVVSDVLTLVGTAQEDIGAVSGRLLWNAPAGSDLGVEVSSVPQWFQAVVDLSVPDTYPVTYAAVRPVDSVAVTYTSEGLRAAQSGAVPGVPDLDHLAVQVLAVPATGADEAEAASQPVQGLLQLGAGGGVVAEVDVPAPVRAFGLAAFELTDSTTTTAPVLDGRARFSSCARRRAGWVGDRLAAISAPTGRRLHAAVPGLRELRLNTLVGLPHTTYGRVSTNPVWVALLLDAPTPADVELATDSWPASDPEASSSWLRTTVAEVQELALDLGLPADGVLSGVDHATSLALELVPQSAKVEGVLQTWDGSAQLADASTDPAVREAAHRRRVDLLAVVPDRLVLHTGTVSRAPLTGGIDHTRPPVSSSLWWTGLRVETGRRNLLPPLPPEATPVLTADVWARVGPSHDPSPGWPSWQQVQQARAHVRMIDTATVVTTLPPPRDDEGKRRLSAGLDGSMTHHLASWEAYAHLPELAAVEISTASTSELGSKAAVFTGLAQQSPDVRVTVDDLLDHDGTSPNQLVLSLADVPAELGAVLHPAADYREAGRRVERLDLQVSGKDEIRVHAVGTWTYGFPHLVPPPSAPVSGTGPSAVVRPEGLSRVDVTAQVPAVSVTRTRRWSAGPAGFEQLRERVLAQCPGDRTLHAHGHLVVDRPADTDAGIAAAASALASSTGVHLVQGSVRVPDYADLSSLDRLGAMGDDGSVYGIAFGLTRLRVLAVHQESVRDVEERRVPVFLAGDSTTHQAGREGVRVSLRTRGTDGPLTITAQQVEERDWPDAPALPADERLRLVLKEPQTSLTFASSSDVSMPFAVGRPRRTARLLMSTGTVADDGSGGDTDTTGQPLGEVEVRVRSLDTTTCRWSPTLASTEGVLQLPGFVLVDSAGTVDPATFPGPGQESTALVMGSWDTPLVFDGLHPVDRHWVTSRMAVTCSGDVTGELDSLSAMQQWNSSTERPTSAPDEITWGGTSVSGLHVAVTPGAAVDATGADPMVTIVQGISGPPTLDDEKKGLAFRVRPDTQLSLLLRSRTDYGADWRGVEDGSSRTFDSSSTLTFTELTGVLAIQPDDPELGALWIALAAAIAVSTVGSFFGPFGGLIGAAAGGGIMLLGVRQTLKDNDPCVRDALTHGSWRVDPDPAKIPPGVSQLFEHFGSGGDPGSWHLTSGWQALVFVASSVLLYGAAALVKLLITWLATLLGELLGGFFFVLV